MDGGSKSVVLMHGAKFIAPTMTKSADVESSVLPVSGALLSPDGLDKYLHEIISYQKNTK